MKQSSRQTAVPDNRPLGVFDSGLGGLTVLAALQKRLPNESMIYLGDTARVPYGNKSPEAIRAFAAEDCGFLHRQGVKAVMVACNSVSSVALDGLHRDNPGKHILGVIGAGVAALRASGARSVAVLGTRATIGSDVYRRTIHAADHAISVRSIACPLLVPMAEEGITSGALLRRIFDLYLAPLRENPPEALLLGCTHYPILREALCKYFGGAVKIIDPATACAEFVARYLEENALSAAPDNPGFRRFYITDMPGQFADSARRFLGYDPGNIEKVSL